MRRRRKVRKTIVDTMNRERKLKGKSYILEMKVIKFKRIQKL